MQMCLWILPRNTYRTVINPHSAPDGAKEWNMTDLYGESWLRTMQVWRTTIQIDSNPAFERIQSWHLWLWCDKIRIWVLRIFRSTHPKFMRHHFFKRWERQSSTGNHQKCKTRWNSKFQSVSKLDGYKRATIYSNLPMQWKVQRKFIHRCCRWWMHQWVVPKLYGIDYCVLQWEKKLCPK